MMKGNKILIIMAAGSGTRMGSGLPKQFLSLGGIPILRRTMETFIAAVPGIQVVTVLPDDFLFGRSIAFLRTSPIPKSLCPEGLRAFIP